MKLNKQLTSSIKQTATTWHQNKRTNNKLTLTTGPKPISGYPFPTPNGQQIYIKSGNIYTIQRDFDIREQNINSLTTSYKLLTVGTIIQLLGRTKINWKLLYNSSSSFNTDAWLIMYNNGNNLGYISNPHSPIGLENNNKEIDAIK